MLNLGSNREISIKDLAQLIASLLNKELKIEIDDQRLRPEKSEVERLLCDGTKAKELTGWEPRHTLEEGLKETIAWLKDHMEHYKPDIYNV